MTTLPRQLHPELLPGMVALEEAEDLEEYREETRDQRHNDRDLVLSPPIVRIDLRRASSDNLDHGVRW